MEELWVLPRNVVRTDLRIAQYVKDNCMQQHSLLLCKILTFSITILFRAITGSTLHFHPNRVPCLPLTVNSSHTQQLFFFPFYVAAWIFSACYLQQLLLPILTLPFHIEKIPIQLGE